MRRLPWWGRLIVLYVVLLAFASLMTIAYRQWGIPNAITVIASGVFAGALSVFVWVSIRKDRR